MAFTLFFQATTWNALKTSILVKKKRQQQQHVSRQTRSLGISNFKAL